MKRGSLLAGSGAVLAARTLPALAQVPAPLPISIGVATVESYAESLYAQTKGFFKTAGLDVQPVTLSGGGAPMTLAVISGTLNAAVANIGSIASAHVRGLGLYLIAPCGLYSSTAPTTMLCAGKDSSVRIARDLEGKTVGVTSLHDLQQASVLDWLEASGANPKAVTFVEVSANETMVALGANRIAAAVVVEPTLTIVKNDIRPIAQPYDVIAKTLLISGWIVNKAWYDGNADAASRLLAAIRTTARWANRNHAETAAILADQQKIPLETISRMNRVVYAEDRNPAVIQPVIDVMVKQGFLPQRFPAADMFPAALARPGPI